MGTKDLYNGELVTQGLDNLDERCKSYYSQGTLFSSQLLLVICFKLYLIDHSFLGARFAKWRAVLDVKDIIGELRYCEIQS